MPLVLRKAGAGDGVPSATSVAGAAAPMPADDRYLWGSYALVAIGAGLGCGLLALINPATAIVTAAGFTAWAPFYILAQGIERLLEPLTNLDGFGKAATSGNGGDESNKTKKEAVGARNEAFQALANADDPELAKTTAQDAATAQAQVDRIRRNRALFAWGLASLIGMAACGAFGLRLMALTGLDVNKYIDVIITGLAVGSGTKPLHDLISNIQKAKDGKSDTPATT